MTFFKFVDNVRIGVIFQKQKVSLHLVPAGWANVASHRQKNTRLSVNPEAIIGYLTRMADPKKRRPENAPGDFYVDAACIDCDTCRWLAPDLRIIPVPGRRFHASQLDMYQAIKNLFARL